MGDVKKILTMIWGGRVVDEPNSPLLASYHNYASLLLLEWTGAVIRTIYW
jgi:hypothetical protein